MYGIRKGSTTFATMGCTIGASAAAIILRGDWELGVQKRYIRYEAAADQLLGRILAGLNIMSVDFKKLPAALSDVEIDR
jgi:hypothetical protein